MDKSDSLHHAVASRGRSNTPPEPTPPASLSSSVNIKPLSSSPPLQQTSVLPLMEAKSSAAFDSATSRPFSDHQGPGSGGPGGQLGLSRSLGLEWTSAADQQALAHQRRGFHCEGLRRGQLLAGHSRSERRHVRRR